MQAGFLYTYGSGAAVAGRCDGSGASGCKGRQYDGKVPYFAFVSSYPNVETCTRARYARTHLLYCIEMCCTKVYCIVSYRIVSYCIILFILLYAAGRVDVGASTSITAHCTGPKRLQQAAYRELQKAAFGYDSAVALGYNSVAAPAEDNEPVPMAL